MDGAGLRPAYVARPVRVELRAQERDGPLLKRQHHGHPRHHKGRKSRLDAAVSRVPESAGRRPRCGQLRRYAVGARRRCLYDPWCQGCRNCFHSGSGAELWLWDGRAFVMRTSLHAKDARRLVPTRLALAPSAPEPRGWHEVIVGTRIPCPDDLQSRDAQTLEFLERDRSLLNWRVRSG
jgi:hypothetical protein